MARGGERLDPETARRVLDRRWGLDQEEAAGLPLASAVAAARVGLGESVAMLAQATLAQLRREGRDIPLSLALDADDAEAVDDRVEDPTTDLSSDLVDWLERGGVVRVGPRLRLRALRELIRRGQPERALSLIEAIAVTGMPSPAEGLERVRALEQLGRAREALGAIDELLSRLAGPDRDRALGLRWRALVDVGEASRARVEADAWAQQREPATTELASRRRVAVGGARAAARGRRAGSMALACARRVRG